MRTSVSLILGLALLSACARPVYATSFGTDVTGAKQYSNFLMDLTVDLDKEKTWDAFLDYSHTQSKQTGEGKSNLFSAGLGFVADDENKFRGSGTYWNDAINKVVYLGPQGSFTHTWYNEYEKPKPKPKVAGVPLTIEEEIGDIPPEEKEEFFGMTIAAEAYFFNIDIDESAGGAVFRRGSGVATASAASLKFTQLHPSVAFEKPLFEDFIVPFFELSHYFYSKDPAAVENALGKRDLHLKPGNVLGGFQRNTWDLGLEFRFKSNTAVRLEYGKSQSVTDFLWASTYGVTLTQLVVSHIRVKAQWIHAVQNGFGDNYYSGGFAYLF